MEINGKWREIMGNERKIEGKWKGNKRKMKGKLEGNERDMKGAEYKW